MSGISGRIANVFRAVANRLEGNRTTNEGLGAAMRGVKNNSDETIQSKDYSMPRARLPGSGDGYLGERSGILQNARATGSFPSTVSNRPNIYHPQNPYSTNNFGIVGQYTAAIAPQSPKEAAQLILQTVKKEIDGAHAMRALYQANLSATPETVQLVVTEAKAQAEKSLKEAFHADLKAHQADREGAHNLGDQYRKTVVELQQRAEYLTRIADSFDS